MRGEAFTGEINLAEFACFPNLQYLAVWDERAVNLEALSRLPKLTTLVLDHCGLTESDLPTIAQHAPQLTTLNISNSGITSIEPLGQGLQKTLTMLDMAGLAVDLTPLGGMENLGHVRLGDDWNGHRISLDLAPLSGLTRLEYLHIFGAKLDNVDAISSMSGLICIDLQNCGLTSAKLTALNGHPLTTEIVLERNFLRTLDGLDLSTLPELKEINLGGNTIRDFSMFDGTAITVYGQDWQNVTY